MNILNQIMFYDKNQCNCEDCKPIVKNENFDDFFIKLKSYYFICKEKEILTIINLKYWYKDSKTKNFIWKALEIHGDKYDYHKTIYIKSRKHVEIECRIKGHQSFKQIPYGHLIGYGCNKCAIEYKAKKLKTTTKEFIKRAKEIHGDKYDYSKVDYINNHTEIIIICKKHGEFKQRPSDHLHSCGCNKCAIEYKANKRRMTLEEFKIKSNEIHGEGRYDYSKVKYINTQTEVIIICPKENHGEFLQTPAKHLLGIGCPICNESKGEITIRNWLIKNKIKFEEQKKFDNCKYKRKLSFDFYINQYNLCIEFDGMQHFYVGGFAKSIEENLEKLKLTQLRDQIKNEYCKNNGINLLRIRYDENVEEKLTEYFQTY